MCESRFCIIRCILSRCRQALPFGGPGSRIVRELRFCDDSFWAHAWLGRQPRHANVWFEWYEFNFVRVPRCDYFQWRYFEMGYITCHGYEFHVWKRSCFQFRHKRLGSEPGDWYARDVQKCSFVQPVHWWMANASGDNHECDAEWCFGFFARFIVHEYFECLWFSRHACRGFGVSWKIFMSRRDIWIVELVRLPLVTLPIGRNVLRSLGRVSQRIYRGWFVHWVRPREDKIWRHVRLGR